MKRGEENRPINRVMDEKEAVMHELRIRGCRITSQRKLLLDIILDQECSCCKEIYYQAVKKDPFIGIATVYRLLKTLEEIGAISRKNMYRISFNGLCGCDEECLVVLKNNQVLKLNSKEFHDALKKGLQVKGFVEDQEIHSVVMQKDA